MLSEDMTQADRKRLAARLAREQLVRFSGVAKDAYTAAGVNSATWDNAINARSMKPLSVIKIVRGLWPETYGDWTAIPGLEPASDSPASHHLAELVDAYQVDHPEATDAVIADAIGVKPKDIASWRTRGIDEGAHPPIPALRELARVIGRDYRTEVLEAVLLDIGWADPPAEEDPTHQSA